VPSGLNADTGEASPATFRAEVTATLVCAKPGLLAAEAQAYVGQLVVLGIGIPRRLIHQVQPPLQQ
jgi:NAD(P)H-hydrate epimerase